MLLYPWGTANAQRDLYHMSVHWNVCHIGEPLLSAMFWKINIPWHTNVMHLLHDVATHIMGSLMMDYSTSQRSHPTTYLAQAIFLLVLCHVFRAIGREVAG